MSNSMRSLRRIKTNSKDAVLSRIPSSSLPASASLMSTSRETVIFRRFSDMLLKAFFADY